jgi:predicted nucleic acid-binding protein
MVLVDTSVLINFFRGRETNGVLLFKDLLSKSIPFGINYFIYQEILQGARNKKEFDLLHKYLSTQIFYHLRNGLKSYEDAAKIYFICRANGITVRSTMDVLIVQTVIENNLFLLHEDRDFSNIAMYVPSLKEYN